MTDTKTKGSRDAVCFTSGPEGAAFGAGVIHAWLASDRSAPHVVAGISTGAVTATAFVRAMNECHHSQNPKKGEAERWGWFDKYLNNLLERPFDVAFKAVPDPVDYFAATAPAGDLSCPEFLKRDEEQARYRVWRLTKLGQLVSDFSLSVGDLGKLAMQYVRFKEEIPVPLIKSRWVAGLWRSIQLYWQTLKVLGSLLKTIAFHPHFTRTWERFAEEQEVNSKGGKRDLKFGVEPLLGWPVWLGSFAALLIAPFVPLLLRPQSFQSRLAKEAEGKGQERSSFSKLVWSAMRTSCLDQSLLSNYFLKRRLYDLFAEHRDREPMIPHGNNARTNLVIVAAAIENVQNPSHQIWAKPGTSLIEALTAAMAVVPGFEAQRLQTNDDLKRWFPEEIASQHAKKGSKILLVDGATIRKNPLPALFDWLRAEPDIAKDLESRKVEDARIHVVYNVPIEPFTTDNQSDGPIDIIDSAKVGLVTRAQRDTGLEVEQTNFRSRLAANIQKLTREVKNGELAIFADQIAPERTLQFENPLSPTRKEGLAAIGGGCRRTLGRLYGAEIQKIAKEQKSQKFVECKDLLREVAHGREQRTFACGLPQVCNACGGKLVAYPEPPSVPAIVHQRFSETDGRIREVAPNLCHRTRPRVAFVASGGVFAGSFHIGMLGAFQSLDLTPDLVVAASVGTLMGGALAAIRHQPSEMEQLGLLAELTEVFMNVDKRVALTLPLKTAAKHLGMRARLVKFSPSKVRKAVEAGTVADPGYASTGVPPIVTDMLSQLFIIPPPRTRWVGSDFLAGRFAGAAGKLLSLIRVNTLESLGIRYSVLGSSLLEQAALLLLRGKTDPIRLDREQPYVTAEGKGTAIFCTTAYINQRCLMLLGRDSLAPDPPAFDFLHAALSSSAFPAAFSARRVDEVFPGSGLDDQIFADGGLFDNLPLLRAIEILGIAQRACKEDYEESSTCSLANPDLLIAGGFDPIPGHGPGFYENWGAIRERCDSLSSASKTDSMIKMTDTTAKLLCQLKANYQPNGEPDPETEDLLKATVVSSIMNVVPSTALHSNPAFAFCRTTGLDGDRLTASIADGCFQMLQKFSTADGRARQTLQELGKPVPKQCGKVEAPKCSFFETKCSFAAAAKKRSIEDGCWRVYQSCIADPLHIKLHAELKTEAEPPEVKPCPEVEEAAKGRAATAR